MMTTAKIDTGLDKCRNCAHIRNQHPFWAVSMKRYCEVRVKDAIGEMRCPCVVWAEPTGVG